MKQILAVATGIFGLVALMGVAGQMDYEAAVDQQNMYCEMVEQHRLDPTTGWPDYNGNYSEICGK